MRTWENPVYGDFRDELAPLPDQYGDFRDDLAPLPKVAPSFEDYRRKFPNENYKPRNYWNQEDET